MRGRYQKFGKQQIAEACLSEPERPAGRPAAPIPSRSHADVPVSSDVGNVRNKRPELVEELIYDQPKVL
jgi:hypothetical protein